MVNNKLNTEEELQKHEGLIRKLAYSMTQDHQEDLIEAGREALISCITKYDKKYRTSFSTYAYKRIKGAMKDELKLLDKPLLQQVRDGVENVEELILKREIAEHIRKNIDKMPAKYRRILKLVYWNGMNFLEISSYLGIAESRVSQLHKEALRRLKKLI